MSEAVQLALIAAVPTLVTTLSTIYIQSKAADREARANEAAAKQMNATTFVSNQVADAHEKVAVLTEKLDTALPTSRR